MKIETFIDYFKTFLGYIRDKKIPKIIFFLIIFTLFLSIFLKVIFPSDIEILYWIFSSVVQSLVALIALVGLVVVYRLGINSNQESLILNNKSRKLEELLTIRGDIVPIWSSEKSEQKLKEIEGSISDKTRYREEINELGGICLKLNKLRKNKDDSRKFFITTSIFISCVIVWHLFLLMFADFILYKYLGLPTLLLTIVLVIYSLYRSGQAISISLRDCQL